jgi:uncharacterized membrane protein
VFFAAILPTLVPAAWRSPHPALRWGRVVFALTGIGFVVYLLYAELFVLNAICLWCTAVHAITFALFALIALATASLEPED